MKMTKPVIIFAIAMIGVLGLTFWASSAGWGLKKPDLKKKSIRHGSVRSGSGHRTHGHFVGK